MATQSIDGTGGPYLAQALKDLGLSYRALAGRTRGRVSETTVRAACQGKRVVASKVLAIAAALPKAKAVGLLRAYGLKPSTEAVGVDAAALLGSPPPDDQAAYTFTYRGPRPLRPAEEAILRALAELLAQTP
jgi:hypothetical protein